MKKKIATRRMQFDGSYKGWEPEKNTLPSRTQPDMTLTMRELLINHTRGLGVNASEHEPLYFDTEIPQLDDMTDIEEYRQFLEDEKNEIEIRTRELLDHKKKFDEQVRERQKAANSKSSTQTSSEEVTKGGEAV